MSGPQESATQQDGLRWIALGPSLLAIWRLVQPPAVGLWRDWVLILSVYSVFSIYRHKSPAWPTVTVATMAFLLGIYVHGQLPYALSALGLAP